MKRKRVNPCRINLGYTKMNMIFMFSFPKRKRTWPLYHQHGYKEKVQTFAFLVDKIPEKCLNPREVYES